MRTEEATDSRKTVSLHTLGCRLNFSETGSIAEGFEKRGYQIVPFGEKADVSFINTCTVTDDADSSCRNLIRKAHRNSPDGTIVVAGCYAQMESDRIAKMQGVDLVLGTAEKYKVFDYLDEEHHEKIHIDRHNEFWGAHTTSSDTHTRAFLKIQDGCNYICSFCIIPFARGRSRTISVSDARLKVIEVARQGFKEIVLTGVNIGEYESSSKERLSDLLKVVRDVEGIERIRLSSVEPNTITDELLNVMKSSDKFLEHFHIPMQSGDDDILKAMRRKYMSSFYIDTINKIKDYFPSAAIGADMIAGFPGETSEQFENTYKLAKELPITHFHVFPYSRRQRTTATLMDNHIPHHEKKRRVKALRDLGEEKLREFSLKQVGTKNEVLFERRGKDGLFTGHTRNYLKVKMKSEIDLKNHILPVYLDHFDESLRAEISQ